MTHIQMIAAALATIYAVGLGLAYRLHLRKVRAQEQTIKDLLKVIERAALEQCESEDRRALAIANRSVDAAEAVIQIVIGKSPQPLKDGLTADAAKKIYEVMAS